MLLEILDEKLNACIQSFDMGCSLLSASPEIIKGSAYWHFNWGVNSGLLTPQELNGTHLIWDLWCNSFIRDTLQKKKRRVHPNIFPYNTAPWPKWDYEPQGSICCSLLSQSIDNGNRNFSDFVHLQQCVQLYIVHCRQARSFMGGLSVYLIFV